MIMRPAQLVAVAVAVAAAAVAAAAGVPPCGRPVWPPHFRTEWTLFNVTQERPLPPLDPGSGAYRTGRGRTYYDWERRSLLEVYDDFCVPIFPRGSSFPCHFLNVGGGASYLLQPKTRQCCVFQPVWSPPPPDFACLLNDSVAETNFSASPVGPAVWYEGGPVEARFGYGFSRRDSVQDPATGTRYSAPAGFFFNAVVGWAQQNFFDFAVERPPASVWAVPDECRNATACTNWP